MPALVTPFEERGEADRHATEAVVERLIEARVDGISALGSTGEFSYLSNDERRRLAEELAKSVAGRVPLLNNGVGASGTKGAVELARRTEGMGCDGVLSGSPYYWKVREKALFKHFAKVSPNSVAEY